MRFPRAFLSVAAASLIATPAFAAETTEAANTATTTATAVGVSPALAAVQTAENTAKIAQAGKAIFTADGRRLGSIYKVASDGSAQVLLSSRLYTIAPQTLTLDGSRIVTSLSKKDIMDRR